MTLDRRRQHIPFIAYRSSCAAGNIGTWCASHLKCPYRLRISSLNLLRQCISRKRKKGQDSDQHWRNGERMHRMTGAQWYVLRWCVVCDDGLLAISFFGKQVAAKSSIIISSPKYRTSIFKGMLRVLRAFCDGQTQYWPSRPRQLCLAPVQIRSRHVGLVSGEASLHLQWGPDDLRGQVEFSVWSS